MKTKRDLENKMDAALIQLQAMLTCTYGNCGDSFRDLSDELQDNFLWACADKLHECKEIFDLINQPHEGAGRAS